jgi:hypothetical protein
MSGTLLWMDPVHETLAVYLSVVSEGGLGQYTRPPEDQRWHLMQRYDLFIDALLGSIVD